MSKPFRLTAEVRSQILGSIRAGGYPHIAAEAWGMTKETFDDWMRRAAEPGAREPYRSFAKDVRLAFAQARLRAELNVFEHEPKIWLIHGPGRETDAMPGWSVSVKAAELSAVGRNVLMDPDLMRLFHKVIEALDRYPDARIEVADALMKMGVPIVATN